MKKKKRKFKKRYLKKKVKKVSFKKKNRKILNRRRRKSKVKKHKSKKRSKSPNKTRNIIVKLIQINEKIKSIVRFNFNLDRSLQNFFQGISNKIIEIKISKKNKNSNTGSTNG